jgi:hypothetical protein
MAPAWRDSPMSSLMRCRQDESPVLADPPHAFIQRFEVLERVITGAAAGSDFFMANIQDCKKIDFVPIAILKIHLRRMEAWYSCGYGKFLEVERCGN